MFGDEIIPSKTSAKDFCSAIFINNQHWRWSRDSAKTLYGSYENFNGDVPIINVDDILRETIKHVNKEHNEAFYRAAYRKFVTVLIKVELKNLYCHEINFKEKVGDTDHIYRILPLPPREGNKRLPKCCFRENVLSHNCFRHRFQKSFFRIRWSTWAIWRQI